MKDFFETVALIIVVPFIVLLKVLILLVLTAWLWAIPLAVLIWALK